MAPEVIQNMGLELIGGTVLLAELGLPIPYLPVLIMGGSWVAASQGSFLPLMGVVLLASLIPNYAWYRLGVLHGRKILGLLCRISLSPDVCVSQTEDIFIKWGQVALPLSKFIPGLSLLASPLAGALGFSRWRFIALDVLGITIYSLAPILLGYFFHDSVSEVLGVLAASGRHLFYFLGPLLALFVLWKWYRRLELRSTAQVHRIGIEELARIMAGERPYVLVDVRSAVAKSMATFPGAIPVRVDGQGVELKALDPETEIIAFCACPNEVSAAKLIRAIAKKGFKHGHALVGGFDALVSLSEKVGDRKS